MGFVWKKYTLKSHGFKKTLFLLILLLIAIGLTVRNFYYADKHKFDEDKTEQNRLVKYALLSMLCAGILGLCLFIYGLYNSYKYFMDNPRLNTFLFLWGVIITMVGLAGQSFYFAYKHRDDENKNERNKLLGYGGSATLCLLMLIALLIKLYKYNGDVKTKVVSPSVPSVAITPTSVPSVPIVAITPTSVPSVAITPTSVPSPSVPIVAITPTNVPSDSTQSK